MTIEIMIAGVLLSFFVVGGLASASGRSWQKWTALVLLASPLLAGGVLLASIIVYGRGRT
jgi:ABC-type multidrug transport system permease subunit